MNEKVHKLAAQEYIKVARDYDKLCLEEKEEDRKTALRVVAAQNYFYAAVNAIEAVLAKRMLHSYSHENRLAKLLENSQDFDDSVVELYPLVDRNERNKVAYRGENGKLYKNIKKMAEAAVGGI
jgi:hypothetical protein